MQIQNNNSIIGHKQYDRFLVKAEKPTEEEILDALGEVKPLWLKYHAYIQANYEFSYETVFFAKNYGWAVRYRKKDRTMCYAFPESEAFSILIVLGKPEAARVEAMKEKLNQKVRRVFEQTEQLHDGKWLWVRVLEQSDFESVLQLLRAKQKPRSDS